MSYPKFEFRMQSRRFLLMLLKLDGMFVTDRAEASRAMHREAFPVEQSGRCDTLITSVGGGADTSVARPILLRKH